MQEQIVSFETAKLAKEKGFDWECLSYYDSGNLKYGFVDDISSKYCCTITDLIAVTTNIVNIEGYFTGACLAPTQSLLQKWLRDVHKVYVIVFTDRVRNDFVAMADIKDDFEGKACFYVEDSYADTYEEALETALLESLKQLN